MRTRRGPCPMCDRGPTDTAFADDGERGWCYRCDYEFRRAQCRECIAPIVWLQTPSGQNVAIDADAFTPGDAGSIELRHQCGQTPERRELRTLSARTTARSERHDWSTLADGIWRRTQGLRGTLGQRYLEQRGCALPPRDSHVRYLPGDDRYPPSLCSAVTDVRTGKPISLHFTRLAADGLSKAGTGCDKRLLGEHRKHGGCIRIWPDEAITHGLAIAEGIETALAAAHIYTPVWATIDAGNLRAFPVLAGIESLVIFADHDDAGLGSADECAQLWRDAGCEVRVLTPQTPGHDAADVRMVAA